MRELFTTLFVFAAAFMLWRALRPQHGVGLGMAHADTTPQRPLGDEAAFKWPALGKFDFAVTEAISHQAALEQAAAASQDTPQGKLCVATLHMGGSRPHVYKPVEVRVRGQRVAFLSCGDASRFQRRLAYEGRAGQTSACDALLIESFHGGKASYDIRLDLKEFRH